MPKKNLPFGFFALDLNIHAGFQRVLCGHSPQNCEVFNVIGSSGFGLQELLRFQNNVSEGLLRSLAVSGLCSF